MSSSLKETIEQEAAKPSSMSSDAGSVSRRSLAELIAADRHIQESELAGKRKLPIRYGKIVPGSAE